MVLGPARNRVFAQAMVLRHRWFRRGIFLMVAAVREAVSGGRTRGTSVSGRLRPER